MSRSDENRAPGPRSRAKLIGVAEKLFAERGIHGVGIREIVTEAGFKNVASIRYHFGTKENLIREIMIGGLHISEEWRVAKLKELEGRGSEFAMRDILLIVVGPVLHGVVTDTFMMFLTQVSLADRRLHDEVIYKATQAGMKRCSEHLRRLSDIDSVDELDTRMALLSIYLTGYMNSHYWRRSKAGVLWRKSVNWRSNAMLEHFLVTAEGILRSGHKPAL
jgi:AcrR family transcriptional regulator